jgi:thymidine phosphorylase
VLGGAAPNVREARRKMEVAISSGRAAEKFAQVIEAQSGDPGVVEDPSRLPQARMCELLTAPRRGFVSRVEPRVVGRGIIALGGGRTRVEDVIDPTVGFIIGAKPGDWVEAGEPVATILARDADGIAAGRATLTQAIAISDEAELPLPLISHRVTAGGVEVYERD